MVHKFSDFASRDGPLEGKKKRIDDILNLEITVINFRVKPSKYPDKCKHYTTIQFELDGEKFVLFTGSLVLLQQLEKYKNKLPFIAKIRKFDQYYTFS
jgi:hypothetical protein